MGKRSDFKRKARDFYKTPYEAFLPLLPFITQYKKVHEPCCGDGALMHHLSKHGIDSYGSDIHPKMGGEFDLQWSAINALNLTQCWGEAFITNPPWERGTLHRIIEHLPELAPTWLLFDADWIHTKQSAPYIKRCRAIVSVGRVKWIPGSKFVGKDNCAWYHFTDDESSTLPPLFYGRKES